MFGQEADSDEMSSDTMRPSTTLDSKRESLICLISGSLVFMLSLVISCLYTEGDQIGYHNAYEVVSGLGFNDKWHEIRAIYTSRVSSDEWVHLLVSLIGGGLGIEKNLLMSVINGVLAAYTVRLLLSWGANLWIAVSLVLGNYYLFVLYFTAERLKFAFLFLVLSLLCSKKPVCFAANALMSVFSHFSVAFIYCGIWLSKIPENLVNRSRIGCMALASSFVVLVVFVLSNSEYLLWKLNTYLHASGPISIGQLLPVIILLLLSSLYAKHKLEPLLVLLPILIGVAVMDGSRLNMLAFFIFLYFGVQTKGGLNAGVIAVMLYLSYKAIMFVKAIFTTGQGFGVSG